MYFSVGMARLTSVFRRLQSYNSLLEKFFFGLSLLGVLTVTHLYIQKGRDFDRGCFGFSSLEAGHLGFDCSAVVSSGAGTFLGLSNITWGFGFYLFVAVLTFTIFQVGASWRRWVHGLRLAGISAGLAYAGYLVYLQVAVINALCGLCLTAAGLTILLFALQVAVLSMDDQSTETPMTSRLFKRDLIIYVYLVAFTVVLVGADLTYYDALAPATEERAQIDKEQYSGAACQLDSSTEPVENNGSSLVAFQDVTKGPSDASVTVIEYFDPNCPHCKTFHKTMKMLVEEYTEDVQFVFKPFPLGARSLPETQALYIANQEGKFFEMLDAQYARQDRSGISNQDLRDIASEIGMNADVLMSQVNQKKYRDKIIAQRKKAIQIGVQSTPTVLVNGHFVKSRSPDCMRTFIKRAKAGKLGSGSSSR